MLDGVLVVPKDEPIAQDDCIGRHCDGDQKKRSEPAVPAERTIHARSRQLRAARPRKQTPVLAFGFAVSGRSLRGEDFDAVAAFAFGGIQGLIGG